MVGTDLDVSSLVAGLVGRESIIRAISGIGSLCIKRRSAGRGFRARHFELVDRVSRRHPAPGQGWIGDPEHGERNGESSGNWGKPG